MSSDKIKERFRLLLNAIESGDEKELDQTLEIFRYLGKIEYDLNMKIDAIQNDINIIKNELNIHTQATNSGIADISKKLDRTVERVENLNHKFDQEMKIIHKDIDMTNELFKLIAVNDLINSIEDELHTDDTGKSSDDVKNCIMDDISSITQVKDSPENNCYKSYSYENRRAKTESDTYYFIKDAVEDICDF